MPQPQALPLGLARLVLLRRVRPLALVRRRQRPPDPGQALSRCPGPSWTALAPRTSSRTPPSPKRRPATSDTARRSAATVGLPSTSRAHASATPAPCRALSDPHTGLPDPSLMLSALHPLYVVRWLKRL